MRNRWEGASDLDEPATITERQLRSLRRGARAGVLAALLALVAAVAAGWSVLMGPDALAGLEGAQDVKHKVLAAIGQPAPAEGDRAPAPATNSLSSPGSEGNAGSARAASGPAAPSKSTVQDSSASRLSASNGR
jgi:hypothetical protein